MSADLRFAAVSSTGSTRRAFVAGSAPAAALAAVLWPRRAHIPDPLAGNAGPAVPIVLFDDRGRMTGRRAVPRLVHTEAEWRALLSGPQFAVTRRAGTEFAYSGGLWNEHRPGLYRCVCCGNAVFLGRDKFDSETGWPSFTAPAAQENVFTRPDARLGPRRTEVLCVRCEAHLGHVFPDGPPPSGLRYCINSVALIFVAA